MGEAISRRMLPESVRSISACLPRMIVQAPLQWENSPPQARFRIRPGMAPLQTTMVKFELNALKRAKAPQRPIIRRRPEGSVSALDFQRASLDMPGEIRPSAALATRSGDVIRRRSRLSGREVFKALAKEQE